MMRIERVLPCALAAGLSLSACGSTAPTHELKLARQAYSEATEPGKPVAAEPMLDAQRTLNAAESEHSYYPRSTEERHLAYIATRKAQIAMAQGQSQVAKEATDNANREYATALEAKDQTQTESTAQLKAERDAAVFALERMGSVSDEGDSMSITLNGGVLFELNQATLLPTAKERLDEVASALKTMPEGQSFTIVGRADTTGTEEFNDKLSQDRADAVREYLISHGVQGEKLVAVGKGEADPVATNTTKKGRETNRRADVDVNVKKPDQTATRDHE
jgi:outer membrane protein OmpA-like peptidoglycan-associated protein